MKPEQPTTRPLAVDIYEAARLLSVHHSTLRRMIRAGTIRPRRLDRKILIPIVELERFLREGSPNGQ